MSGIINKRKAEVVILWSDKVDFRAKRERKSLGTGKGSLQQEDIAFLNVYEANDKAENMEAKTEIKREIDIPQL